MKAVLATLETRNHRFETVAWSRDDAVDQLRLAWERHCEQTAAYPAYFDELSADIRLSVIHIGSTVLRDGEEI